MTPLFSKYAFVTLLIATVTIRCSPLPLRNAEPVLERQLLDSIGDLFDEAGTDSSNRTPTLPVAEEVFAELTRGALYSNAAYCSAGSVESLSCGATCEALGDIQVAFTGGDNEAVPACKGEFHLSKVVITHAFSHQFSLRLIRRFKVLWSLRRVLSQLNLCQSLRIFRSCRTH
jgi:hypothetical protein